MKRGISLLMIMLFALVCFAQTQQGGAYRYNGKNARTPLGNVTISYDGNKKTTISADDGKFSLTLTGRKMGDRIGLVTVKKREMMVFNQHAVDEWSVRKEPLMLILCNADEFEKQKENLINIGRREAKKKYDKQKAELEKQLSASQIKEAEYEAALDKAYEELERLQKNIGEYADLFARIDESEIDTLAQQAVELFNQGDVERAIELFEQGNYMEKLDKAISTSQQADELRAIAEEAKEKATQDSLKALQSLKAQIEAYKVNNEWQKAGELLKGLADRLNTVEDCWVYAYFCYHQNNFKEAEFYYQQTMTLLESEKEKESLDYQSRLAVLLNNLANLYYFTQRFTESEQMYKEALEIRQRLAQANPQAYEPDVAATLNNLAILYSNTQRLSESEQMYKEALEILQRLALANPQAYEPDVAMTLNNLAALYDDTQKYTESEQMYKEALEISQRLAQANPQAYEPYVATTLNNLAILYFNTQRFSESEQMYKESLEIYQRLAQANPQAYEPDVAQTQYNIGLLKVGQEQYADAIPPFEGALEIYRRVSKVNPAQQQWYVISLYYLSFLYSATNNPIKAYQINQEWIPISKEMYEASPEELRGEYASKLGSQSFCAIFMKQYTESEKLAREGLLVDSTQHFIYSNLAAALLFQGKYSEAEAIYRQYKDEMKESFLNDFKQYTEAGVIPPEYEADVEKIKRMLEEE